MGKTDSFWFFVRERERIRIQKEAGYPPPFTEDRRLRDYWFPNIRRTDDPATRWLHGELLHKLDGIDLVLAIVAFRLFGGSVPTGQLLAPMFLRSGYHEGQLLDAVGPVEAPFRSRVPESQRARSLAAVAATCERVRVRDGLLPLLGGATLREATRGFSEVYGIGPIVAYEIVCDLRMTPVLQDAQDVLSWGLPGVAAVASASALLGRELAPGTRGGRLETVRMMRRLLPAAREVFPEWEASEIQRALTLFHNWDREVPPKRRYRWR